MRVKLTLEKSVSNNEREKEKKKRGKKRRKGPEKLICPADCQAHSHPLTIKYRIN